ncbi:MAG TPA: hypothetical protein VG225_13870 [Terracidiphilus sp.]|nr:hypothetical protein [Terracidiphilus sp.]
MIPELRNRFNRNYSPEKYATLLARLEERCGTRVEFRVAETPIFVEKSLLDRMAKAGAEMAGDLMGDAAYLEAARRAIPAEYRVAGECRHPHFLTADFALLREADGALAPRLVEIQAFPSVYAYQAVLCHMYRQVYELDAELGCFLGGLDKDGYVELLSRTVLGGQDPMHVVLTEIDPQHQKTLPDFNVTARKLGITVVDIRALQPEGDKLHYRNAQGKLVPIHRIYNRAIVDELIARNIKLPFDLTRRWDVEWAGHPNWYFLISKFSLPWLTRRGGYERVVPPAVFLNDFLDGDGRQRLEAAGVKLPAAGSDAVYRELLLKPLFSFAGKGIEFDPAQARLEAIPAEQRSGYLLQQRMHFEPTIETPFGRTQTEIRILYLWADRGTPRPALSLVRLGRGKMMGVDHNRDQQWVGGSAAFYPKGSS